MTIATLDEVATWDEEGNVEGFQFDSRERSVQEWRDKKEDDEYSALFERLAKRNWAAEARKDESFRVRKNEILRAFRERHRDRYRQLDRDRRRAKYEANPVVNQCEECKETWVVPYERQGQRSSRFCSTKCRNRWNGIRRAAKRNRGLRKMDVKPLALRFVRANPGCTSEMIGVGVGAKVNSVRSLIATWVAAGDLRREGKKPIRYWVADREA